jgi:hypothetical protein
MDRREVNEFRLHAFGRDVDRAIAFICECEDSGCTRTVVLTRAAYDELRRHGKTVLFPTHVPDEDAPLRAEQEETRAAQRGGPRSTEALEVETGS